MINTQIEKVFFNYIINNKKFLNYIEPKYFNNQDIRDVYTIIRDYIMNNATAPIPTLRQIWDMVCINNKKIEKEIFKSIFKIDLNEYDEKNFIIPKLKSWILYNKIKYTILDVIDYTRNADEIIFDYEKLMNLYNIIKDKIDNIKHFDQDDDDLGLDFDEPKHHNQDLSVFKIKTGFDTIDEMLGGGWDIQTLNVIMGQTSVGKSLWLQNFTVKAADMGYNVLYITLEMSEKKVMKRIGSIRLKIPINKYDELSKDEEYIKNKIIEYRSKNNYNNFFNTKFGKIIIKFWSAGSATINDFDIYIKRLMEKTGIKIDVIIIDYMTLIAPIKGVSGDSLYMKGKHLAEGLRSIAAKYNCPVITAVQVSRDAWNANDITLESVPESKAIAETADTFFAIIRLKNESLYRFKLLKQRDGGFNKTMIQVSLNKEYLLLENDEFVF